MLVIIAERWVKTSGMLEGGSENSIRKMYIFLALAPLILHKSLYDGEFVSISWNVLQSSFFCNTALYVMGTVFGCRCL